MTEPRDILAELEASDATRRYSHPEFPELTLRRSDGPYSGNTVIMWYDRASNQHIEIPARALFWQLSCLVNNHIACDLAAHGQKQLAVFFRKLARDIDQLGTLLTPPENCSPATKGNLEHFHKRALGDDTGW